MEHPTTAMLEAGLDAPVHRVVATIGFRRTRQATAAPSPIAVGLAEDYDLPVRSMLQVGKAVLGGQGQLLEVVLDLLRLGDGPGDLGHLERLDNGAGPPRRVGRPGPVRVC